MSRDTINENAKDNCQYFIQELLGVWCYSIKRVSAESGISIHRLHKLQKGQAPTTEDFQRLLHLYCWRKSQ